MVKKCGIVAGDRYYKWINRTIGWHSTNFNKGIPHFGGSIALIAKGRLDQAVCIRPHSSELFTASKARAHLMLRYP